MFMSGIKIAASAAGLRVKATVCGGSGDPGGGGGDRRDRISASMVGVKGGIRLAELVHNDLKGRGGTRIDTTCSMQGRK